MQREQIGQRTSPLDVSPANREVSDAHERRAGDDARQALRGEQSKRTSTSKHEPVGRYDDSTSTATGGTGLGQTRRDEKPGPAFSGTRGR